MSFPGGTISPVDRNPALMRELGLSDRPRSEWPAVATSAINRPIEALKPRSEHHRYVLDYLLSRLDASERKMRDFYPRWQATERRYQAYIQLNDFEKELRRQNEVGRPAKRVSITVPYQFFTINTIVTYLLQVFAGRRPLFAIGTNDPANFNNAQALEQLIQYQADHNRLIKSLHHFLHDTQLYGIGILRTRWDVEERNTTVFRQEMMPGPSGPTPHIARSRQRRVVYEGNITTTVDPFRFFPDPRVPMEDCAELAEWVAWRMHMGRHELKSLEHDGLVTYVDAAGSFATPTSFQSWGSSGDSARNAGLGGDAHAGLLETPFGESGGVTNNVQIDQGSFTIIPRELGLGHETRPTKWMFTIANRRQIIQADPLLLDHDMHPVAVAEPHGTGYAFGSLAPADLLGPIQDQISFLINSHGDNVAKVLNDMFVVDPNAIEMQDLKRPGPGKIIRLKRSHFGMDVRQAVSQLPVQDVTRQHIEDAQAMMALGERISAVSENLLGIQDTGGRKTATEVRTALESGASRLAAQARIISAQAITLLTKQYAMNNQQLMSREFYVRVLGQEGMETSLRVGPEHISGDFYYPISDGTLPMDRVALLDQWKEIFGVVLQDPQLRLQYDLPKMFEFIADLGGAVNIKAMRSDQMEIIQQQAQAGNLLPTNQAGALPQFANSPNAVPAEPGRRAAGAIQ